MNDNKSDRTYLLLPIFLMLIALWGCAFQGVLILKDIRDNSCVHIEQVEDTPAPTIMENNSNTP